MKPKDLDLFQFERNFYQKNQKMLFGIDEVGRGPLAGPVVIAGVLFPPDTKISGVWDSKKLSAKKREELFPIIKEKSLFYSIQVVDSTVIDTINIYQATKRAMEFTVLLAKNKYPLDHVFVDGNMKLSLGGVPYLSIVKGDMKSFTIASASILAKVVRDHIMEKLALECEHNYFWDKNKGYPTLEHRRATFQYGRSPFHRRTFRVHYDGHTL